MLRASVGSSLFLTLALVLGGCAGEGDPSRSGETARVERIVDGDTVVLQALGKSRLIGVDTPEVYGRSECFGSEASAFAKRVLSGQTVRYQIGPEPRDRYGRALVYLYLRDGRSFNEMLVRQGYARPLAIAPNVEHAALFQRRASEAREARRGLWSPRTCTPKGRQVG